MATGLPGADSSQPVNTEVNGQNLVQLATGVFGQTPVFWGRYFTSASTTGTVEYNHSQENCAEQTIDCNQTNPNVDIQSLLLSS
jgi:hypothetical protein